MHNSTPYFKRFPNLCEGRSSGANIINRSVCAVFLIAIMAVFLPNSIVARNAPDAGAAAGKYLDFYGSSGSRKTQVSVPPVLPIQLKHLTTPLPSLPTRMAGLIMVAWIKKAFMMRNFSDRQMFNR